MSYEELKTQICKPCDADTLKRVISTYEDQIKSRRRCEAIETINDLIKLLERRGVLSETAQEPLLNIAQLLTNVPTAPVSPVCTSERCLPEQQPPQNDEQPDGICPSQNRYYPIYKMIAVNIGRAWKELARNLDVREGTIDSLEQQYKTIEERVYKVLQEHRSQPHYCDKSYISSLLDGLSKARRNDLRKMVTTLLDTM